MDFSYLLFPNFAPHPFISMCPCEEDSDSSTDSHVNVVPYPNVVPDPNLALHSIYVTISLPFRLLGMHRKSMEAAETLKNDDSGGSDREDTASKASDSSMQSPHSRSYSSGNVEQNNNKISMGDHNSQGKGVSAGLPNNKDLPMQHQSPDYRTLSPGSVEPGTEKCSPAISHHGLPPPPPTGHLPGKLSAFPSTSPGLGHHHHIHGHLHPTHHHMHPHLAHQGMSPPTTSRHTPPNSSLSLATTPPAISNRHQLGLSGLEPAKSQPGVSAIGTALHPESDPESFRWVNSNIQRDPECFIR